MRSPSARAGLQDIELAANSQRVSGRLYKPLSRRRERSSVFAVLTLMTSSTFVSWITGRSAGFSPLRFFRCLGDLAILFSKCLVENTVVRHHCEPDHNGNKRYLRADAQNDTLF